MKFTTTTPQGCEGHSISYLTENKCANSLKSILPKGWEIHFEWAQILFSDVQYEIKEEDKKVNVVYNQNLSYWWPQVREAIEKGIATPSEA